MGSCSNQQDEDEDDTVLLSIIMHQRLLELPNWHQTRMVSKHCDSILRMNDWNGKDFEHHQQELQHSREQQQPHQQQQQQPTEFDKLNTSGNGNVITIPDAVVEIPQMPNQTCAEFQQDSVLYLLAQDDND